VAPRPFGAAFGGGLTYAAWGSDAGAWSGRGTWLHRLRRGRTRNIQRKEEAWQGWMVGQIALSTRRGAGLSRILWKTRRRRNSDILRSRHLHRTATRNGRQGRAQRGTRATRSPSFTGEHGEEPPLAGVSIAVCLLSDRKSSLRKLQERRSGSPAE
jgi:hypothetical protein